ncbi:hypothetical protein FGO68_gene9291 [Halteria grandinella]|uniref:Uncharacterized protein n=1 Tax=Halteria grandinella TaxID=5974 RepID=A0A8J8T3S8_HALGN|nr:hypothetical protein FGO68_gene9291 [Halteria grandinella]
MYFAFSYSMLSFTLTDSLSYTRNCSFSCSNSFFCCCIEVMIWSVLSMSSTPTGFWVVDCVVWWVSCWRAWVSLDWSLPMLFLAVSSSKGMRCESWRFSMFIYSAHCCLILVIYFFSLSLHILFKSPSSQLINAGVKSLPFFSLNQCATLKASSGSHSSIKLFFYCFETTFPPESSTKPANSQYSLVPLNIERSLSLSCLSCSVMTVVFSGWQVCSKSSWHCLSSLCMMSLISMRLASSYSSTRFFSIYVSLSTRICEMTSSFMLFWVLREWHSLLRDSSLRSQAEASLLWRCIRDWCSTTKSSISCYNLSFQALSQAF